MSGRSRRDEVAPSLFPFLAVLLCTMGALVLILMLIVSNAQATAKEIAASAEAEQISEEMVALSEEMQKVRANQQLELDRKQGELAHVEDHIQRLQNQMEELVSKYEKLAEEKDRNNNEQADWEKKKRELELAISQKEEEIKEKEEEAKNKKPAYSIIPYQGPNGTSRRPIYLECVADGLIIQPDGFKLSLRDLKPPHGPGNPLDSVLRAIRNHLESIDATGGATPYPLLIVRPDGIRTYAMARGAMASWDDQFGYELVANELTLKFPKFERPLDVELEKIVAQARERQIALIAAMPNRMRGMLQDELGEDGDSWGPIEGNGDGLAHGEDEEGDLVFAEDAEMIQKFPDGTSLPAPGSGAPGSRDSRVGTGNDPTMGNRAMGDRALGSTSGFGVSALSAPSVSSNGTRLANSGLAGTGGQRPLNVSGSQGVGLDPNNNSGIPGTGETFAAGERGGANSGQSQSPMVAGDTSVGAENANGQQLSDNRLNKDEATAANYGYTASNSASSRSGDSGNGDASGRMAKNGKASGVAPPQDSVYRDVAGGSDSAMGPAGGEGGPGFTLSSSNASSSNSSSSNASKSKLSSQDDKNAQPPKDSDSGPSGSGVVVSRGNDWTRQNIRGTAVERTIRIRCQEDRWVLQPEPGQQGTKTIFLRKGLTQARTDLSKALQGRVDSWGMALAGGYWKPKIVVTIDPNAQHRYEQLQRVLQGSGIDVIHEEAQNGQKTR